MTHTALTHVADVWARFGDRSVHSEAEETFKEILELRGKARKYLNLMFDMAILQLEAEQAKMNDEVQ